MIQCDICDHPAIHFFRIDIPSVRSYMTSVRARCIKHSVFDQNVSTVPYTVLLSEEEYIIAKIMDS